MIVNKTSAPSLPNEVLRYKIAPRLSLGDYAIMAKVCSHWGTVFTEICDEKLYERYVFDEKKWLQIPGVNSVSAYKVDPERKKGYVKRLKRRCDIFNTYDPIQPHRFEKRTNYRIWRIWETHLVILIPEKINEEPVTINLLGQIPGFQEEYTGTAFVQIDNRLSKFLTIVSERTYFVEVTMDVIPGSRGTKHEEKVNKLLKPKGYRVPSPLEAAISNLVLNRGKKNEFFFGQEGKHGTSTATHLISNDGWSLVIGGNTGWGPRIAYFPEVFDSVGVMGVRNVL